jgi:hypothetical protein
MVVQLVRMLIVGLAASESPCAGRTVEKCRAERRLVVTIPQSLNVLVEPARTDMLGVPSSGRCDHEDVPLDRLVYKHDLRFRSAKQCHLAQEGESAIATLSLQNLTYSFATI